MVCGDGHAMMVIETLVRECPLPNHDLANPVLIVSMVVESWISEGSKQARLRRWDGLGVGNSCVLIDLDQCVANGTCRTDSKTDDVAVLAVVMNAPRTLR